MTEKNLGIIGGGQLGSMLSVAAKKLNVNTIVYCDDIDAPAQNFCDEFIFGKYDDKIKIDEFVNKVDIITFELVFDIIDAASNPALIAPSSPIASVPTGTPFGICAIESKLSNPFSFLLSIGTPKTGIVVNDDIIPGK